MADVKPVPLRISLYPHRSLSGFGLKVVLGLVVASNLAIAIFFWALRAWPVFGFLGLDVALIFAAFAINNRNAKRFEQIVIEGDDVTFIRADWAGEKKSKFNRRWMRVDLEFDEARELVGRLFLVSYGKRTEVGSFLGLEERKALARELRRVIA